MKKFAVLCALTVFVAGCNATGTAVKTDEDKQSYALGYNVGATLKQQGFELKSKVLAKGVTDALSGKPAISEEEIAKVLTELRKEKIAELQKQQVEIAKINLAASQSFLTKNKVKKGVVTLPSGLQYKVIRAGKGKKSPKSSDQVSVHYRGTLLNGTEFDSSYKRKQPAKFPVNGVIAGWTEALQKMKAGDKWMLFVPPNLGYGARGAGQLIQANSALIFEVELLGIL